MIKTKFLLILRLLNLSCDFNLLSFEDLDLGVVVIMVVILLSSCFSILEISFLFSLSLECARLNCRSARLLRSLTFDYISRAFLGLFFKRSLDFSSFLVPPGLVLGPLDFATNNVEQQSLVVPNMLIEGGFSAPCEIRISPPKSG